MNPKAGHSLLQFGQSNLKFEFSNPKTLEKDSFPKDPAPMSSDLLTS